MSKNKTKREQLDAHLDTLSPGEVRTILQQLEHHYQPRKRVRHRFGSKRARIGVLGDMHIGHKEFDEALLMRAFEFYKQNSVDVIYQCGDILEGMSGRPGHIYELSEIGYQPQIERATDLISQSPVDFFAITGNHDQWYLKKHNAGVDVGAELEQRVKTFHYLGMNEADVNLFPNVTMKLFHPNDGSAYALSYKMQKLIESFGGGEKPNLVFQGHYHKAMYVFTRGVHGYEAGCLSNQSEFMRLKKLPAHKGFWMVDIFPNKAGVERVTNTFVPEYD